MIRYDNSPTGAGVESMTLSYGPGAQPASYSEVVLENQEAQDCLIPMGITSENVAAQYNISRRTQDEFAAESFRRAAAAQKAGKFAREIVSVTTKIVDPKTEEEKEIVVDRDDGVRDGVTADSLAKLKPAFKKDGTTHAGWFFLPFFLSFCQQVLMFSFCFLGNASQVSDGAAAVLLARRSVAKKLGLPIVGKYVTAAVVGVPPKIMGFVFYFFFLDVLLILITSATSISVGPAYAIPRVLQLTGLTISDVDFYEINEAFASQAVYSVKELGIPFEKVNVWGGAIALGHPLGCSK